MIEQFFNVLFGVQRHEYFDKQTGELKVSVTGPGGGSTDFTYKKEGSLWRAVETTTDIEGTDPKMKELSDVPYEIRLKYTLYNLGIKKNKTPIPQ